MEHKIEKHSQPLASLRNTVHESIIASDLQRIPPLDSVPSSLVRVFLEGGYRQNESRSGCGTRHLAFNGRRDGKEESPRKRIVSWNNNDRSELRSYAWDVMVLSSI